MIPLHHHLLLLLLPLLPPTATRIIIDGSQAGSITLSAAKNISGSHVFHAHDDSGRNRDDVTWTMSSSTDTLNRINLTSSGELTWTDTLMVGRNYEFIIIASVQDNSLPPTAINVKINVLESPGDNSPSYNFFDVSGSGVLSLKPNVNKADIKGNLVIPEHLNGTRITSIGNSAFSGCSFLNSIDLRSVTSIGYNAFYGCSSLSSIDLGSVTTIGYSAFQGCSSLRSVDLWSVTSIGNYAFASCSSLNSVILGSSVTSIGNGAFQNCSSLSSITYTNPAAVNDDTYVMVQSDGTFNESGGATTTITSGNGGFLTQKEYVKSTPSPDLVCIGSLAIGSIKMPTSVNSIRSGAFSNCSSLSSIDLGSVTSIGSSAFEFCSSLSSINLGSVDSIDGYVFSHCSSLSSVTYTTPATVNDDTYVMVQSDGTFNESGGATTTITSSNGGFLTQKKYVKSPPSAANLVCIGSLALGSIKMPTTVTSFVSSAFSGCSSLSSVNLGSVTMINNYVFNGCFSLRSIDLGSVTSIGDSAFAYCSSLSSVDLGSVNLIDGYAFQYCSSLSSINLGSVPSIGTGAFDGCSSLSSVNLGSVTSIGDNAFYNCSSLSSITYTTPGTVDDNTYVIVDSDGIPASANTTTTIGGGFLTQNKYVKSPTPSSDLVCIGNLALGSIKMPTTVTSIGSNAFRYCSSLRSIDLGSVNSIGGYAFQNCSSLSSVNLGSVTSIGDNAFLNCSSLNSVILGSSVTSIGSGAFQNCSSLSSITYTNPAAVNDDTYVMVKDDGTFDESGGATTTITSSNGGFLTQKKYVKSSPSPDLVCIGNLAIGSIKIPSTVTSIRYTAFAYCSSLSSVDLGSVTSIGDSAFQGCSSLRSVDLGSVTSISDYAFYDCSSLNSVDLGSVTAIGTYAFNNCTSLSSVNLGSVTSIGDGAFNGCSSLSSVDLGSVTTIGISAFAFCSSLSSIIFTSDAPENIDGWNSDSFLLNSHPINIDGSFKDNWFSILNAKYLDIFC